MWPGIAAPARTAARGHRTCDQGAPRTAKIAVIHESATGNVHRLAHAVTEGAEAAGSEVRLRHVAETAPEEAIAQNPDTTGPLWSAGKPADKVAAGSTSSQNAHGGQESTLLALYNTMYHRGAIIAGPGHTDPRVFGGGGNPYGAGAVEGTTEGELAAAGDVGERVATIADRLAA